MPNLEPGNTDPSVPLALKIPLEDYRSRALLQSTKAKATVLINQLEFQASQMVQGGKKTWWDTQDFREIIPTGVSYECKSELGIGESLAGGDCRKASFNFIQQGEATIAHNIPLEFESGMKLKAKCSGANFCGLTYTQGNANLKSYRRETMC